MIDSEGVILHHSFCFFHKFLIRHSTYFPLDGAILADEEEGGDGHDVGSCGQRL